MSETNDNVRVTTTFTSQMDGEVEVEPENYLPTPPPEAAITTSTTTDTDRALRAEDGVALVDSSLADFREVDSGDGIRVTTYEPQDSSRHRSEGSFDDYRRELDKLKFPEDSEFLAQQAEQEGEAAPQPTPPEANMIPAAQVNEIVEQRLVLREHQQRMDQAMLDPQFAEIAQQVMPNAPDVALDPQIVTAIAAQVNSPAVALFLNARPEIAQQVAAMPVARAVAEVARLSAWLQFELQQNAPQNAAPRRASTAPAPITPLGGSPTRTNAVDLNTCDYQTYRRIREQGRKNRHGR